MQNKHGEALIRRTTETTGYKMYPQTFTNALALAERLDLVHQPVMFRDPPSDQSRGSILGVQQELSSLQVVGYEAHESDIYDQEVNPPHTAPLFLLISGRIAKRSISSLIGPPHSLLVSAALPSKIVLVLGNVCP